MPTKLACLLRWHHESNRAHKLFLLQAFGGLLWIRKNGVRAEIGGHGKRKVRKKRHPTGIFYGIFKKLHQIDQNQGRGKRSLRHINLMTSHKFDDVTQIWWRHTNLMTSHKFEPPTFSFVSLKFQWPLKQVQWESEIRAFKNRKHLKTEHFEGQISDGICPVFGYVQFLDMSGFQMVISLDCFIYKNLFIYM